MEGYKSGLMEYQQTIADLEQQRKDTQEKLDQLRALFMEKMNSAKELLVHYKYLEQCYRKLKHKADVKEHHVCILERELLELKNEKARGEWEVEKNAPDVLYRVYDSPAFVNLSEFY